MGSILRGLLWSAALSRGADTMKSSLRRARRRVALTAIGIACAPRRGWLPVRCRIHGVGGPPGCYTRRPQRRRRPAGGRGGIHLVGASTRRGRIGKSSASRFGGACDDHGRCGSGNRRRGGTPSRFPYPRRLCCGAVLERWANATLKPQELGRDPESERARTKCRSGPCCRKVWLPADAGFPSLHFLFGLLAVGSCRSPAGGR